MIYLRGKKNFFFRLSQKFFQQFYFIYFYERILLRFFYTNKLNFPFRFNYIKSYTIQNAIFVFPIHSNPTVKLPFLSNFNLIMQNRHIYLYRNRKHNFSFCFIFEFSLSLFFINEQFVFISVLLFVCLSLQFVSMNLISIKN